MEREFDEDPPIVIVPLVIPVPILIAPPVEVVFKFKVPEVEV